jgi:hypothetical protein
MADVFVKIFKDFSITTQILFSVHGCTIGYKVVFGYEVPEKNNVSLS